MASVRLLTKTMTRWGLGFGVVTGVGIAAISGVVGWLFTTDPGVHAALTVALLVMAVGQPLAGYVFVLDGVLIGAGDARYLALAGLANLVIYLPLLYWVGQAGLGDTIPGMLWVWVAFSVGYMGARGLTLGLRARTGRWMQIGVPARRG